jgi:predicted transcriptional regulator
MGKTGDTSNQNLDSSWVLLFETDGEKYTITYRGVRYIFESDKEVKFYFDETDRIYDSRSG